MDITLSISLLASNRKESLERCLDSLKPLLVKIPCELIIVLTSTEADVQRIAESYTPQVIPFEWCNDFSAARNAGLKVAQGEWFLYIDDDEWFDDVAEVCEFFLSGEYKNYRSAHYIQRNYQNWSGTKHSDFSAFRMVQRFSETHFEGTIHEELTPRMEPCRYLKVFVHHYGYAKDYGCKSACKTSRNIPLLLQAIENQPEKIKNYIQLAKESDLSGNWKSAEEYCRMGLAVCRESSDFYSEGWLLAFRAYLISKNPGKTSAIAEIEDILQQRKPSQIIQLVLYQQLIHLCAEEKEPEKAIHYGLAFENLLKEMDEQDALWAEQSYGEFDENYIKNPERIYNTRADCVTCALEIQDWDKAADFLKIFPWETEELLERFYPAFEKWKENGGSHFWEILLEILSELAASLEGLDIFRLQENHDVSLPTYLLLQKALQSLENEKNEEGLHLFIYCMANAKDGFLQKLCLKEAIYRQISVIPLVMQVDLDTWNTLVEKVVNELPFTLNDRIRVCAEETRAHYPLYSLCLKKYYLEQKLRKGFPLWDDFIETLEAYCLCILEFYKGLYRDELFAEGTKGILPADCRGAQTALMALEKLKQQQMAEAIRLFGEVFHTNLSMTGMVTELFRQAVRRMDDPALGAGLEFRQLAGQMKAALHALMTQGQLAQAGEILNQLLLLMPEDMEIIRIRQEIIRREKSKL